MDTNVDKKNIAGVSLIEIMISLVLVAIGLIAITSTFPNINKSRKGIQEADQAKIIATDVLEGLQYLTAYNAPNTDPKIEWCKSPPLTVAEKADCDTFVTRYKNKTLAMGTAVVCTVSWGPRGQASWGGDTVSVIVKWRKNGKLHKVKVTGAL
jgi:Tfp pilus assembly protein PilV